MLYIYAIFIPLLLSLFMRNDYHRKNMQAPNVLFVCLAMLTITGLLVAVDTEQALTTITYLNIFYIIFIELKYLFDLNTLPRRKIIKAQQRYYVVSSSLDIFLTLSLLVIFLNGSYDINAVVFWGIISITIVNLFMYRNALNTYEKSLALVTWDTEVTDDLIEVK